MIIALVHDIISMYATCRNPLYDTAKAADLEHYETITNPGVEQKNELQGFTDVGRAGNIQDAKL